jgi:ATP-dependent Lon protease
VIIPEDNKKDLVDMPANITTSLDIHPVRWIDEVLDIALERPLQPSQATDLEEAHASKEGAPVDEAAEVHSRTH